MPLTNAADWDAGLDDAKLARIADAAERTSVIQRFQRVPLRPRSTVVSIMSQ